MTESLYDTARDSLSASHFAWHDVLFDEHDGDGQAFGRFVVNTVIAVTRGDLRFLQSVVTGEGKSRQASVLAFTEHLIVDLGVSQANPQASRIALYARSAVRSIRVTALRSDFRSTGRGLTDVSFELTLDGLAEPLRVGVNGSTVRDEARAEQQARVVTLFESFRMALGS